MDHSNDTLSKVPVSELTPENLDALKNKSGAPAPKREKNKLPLLIAGAILLVAVGVALYFIFRPSPQDGEETSDPRTGDEAILLWEPDPESEDPSADYVNHHQETINNPDATADEKLDAELSIANLYTATERFAEAESLLNGIERAGLTHRQLFNLYSAYVYLYDHNGNTSAYEEYSNLVEDELNEFWDEAESNAAESETNAE